MKQSKYCQFTTYCFFINVKPMFLHNLKENYEATIATYLTCKYVKYLFCIPQLNYYCLVWDVTIVDTLADSYVWKTSEV
jgi:hypothetical protein